jgi:hypothetical protein
MNKLFKNLDEYEQFEKAVNTPFKIYKAESPKKGFKEFLIEAKSIIENIAKYRKEGNNKEVENWHAKLDTCLHNFVGEKNLTPTEKKKGIKVSKGKKDLKKFDAGSPTGGMGF